MLGDNAVTEGFAFLLEHLTGDARWLAARLDMPRSDQFVRFSAFVTLFFLRRYCAKLRYELELHSGAPLGSLPGRYAQLLSSAVGVPYPESDFLEDVDGGFYCTCYLRAWAFEAQLSDWLRERYGTELVRAARGGHPGAGAVGAGPVAERRRAAARGDRPEHRLRRAFRPRPRRAQLRWLDHPGHSSGCRASLRAER